MVRRRIFVRRSQRFHWGHVPASFVAAAPDLAQDAYAALLVLRRKEKSARWTRDEAKEF